MKTHKSVLGAIAWLSLASLPLAQGATASCDQITLTNTYGLPGNFFLFVSDSYGQTILSQTLSVATSNGTANISLAGLLSAGSTYTVLLETYGSSGFGPGFSNYILTLTSNMTFNGGGQTESGLIYAATAGAKYTFVKNGDGQCPTLVDPINTSDLNGSSIIDPGSLANAEILVAQGREVQGVAADGTARLLVRVPVPTAGQVFSAMVLKEDGSTPSTDPTAEGGIATVPSANLGQFQSTVPSVMSLATAIGSNVNPTVFLVYQAPQDFVRSVNGVASTTDQGRTTRQVFLKIQPSTGSAIVVPVTIARPPVILIHGYTGDPSLWSDFNLNPVPTGPQFSVSIVDYSNAVPGSVSNITNPDGSIDTGNFVLKANLMGLDYNSIDVLSQIQRFIADYRNPAPLTGGAPIAVAQADIIAHSMGGLVTKMIPRFQMARYYVPENYKQGFVHKLITIGTPNRGSPLASALMLSRNFCSWLGQSVFNNEPALVSAEINGIVYPAGNADLCDTCHEGGMSAALLTLQQPAMLPLKIARLGGVMGSARYLSMLLSPGKLASDQFCLPISLLFGYSTQDIPQNYSPVLWPVLMKGPSDGIVPVNSAMDQASIPTPSPDGMTWFDAIHGPGTRDLFPLQPYLTLSVTTVPARAQALLNTPISDPVFQVVP